MKRIQVNLDNDFAADLTSMSNRKYIYILRCSHVSLGELITPLDLIEKPSLLMKMKSIAPHLQFHSLMILKFLPPVTEKGFKPDELAELHWVKRNEDENLLILYQQCKSIKTSNGKLLGSIALGYARSSVALEQDFTKAFHLAEIQFFANCFIEKSYYLEEILACIKFFCFTCM